MEIKNTQVTGFCAAFQGLRNPMNSWSKSDSLFFHDGQFTIGNKDNKLAMKLIKAGPEHRKFIRLIHVSCFITLPRYIWQELDTYKVATVRMSCSTMHKLGSRELTPDDFQDGFVLEEVLKWLNYEIGQYKFAKDVERLRKMKQSLPEGFLQSATFDMNYETAINMYHQRKKHRMIEWSGKDGICKWIESLPLMDKWLSL